MLLRVTNVENVKCDNTEWIVSFLFRVVFFVVAVFIVRRVVSFVVVVVDLTVTSNYVCMRPRGVPYEAFESVLIMTQLLDGEFFRCDDVVRTGILIDGPHLKWTLQARRQIQYARAGNGIGDARRVPTVKDNVAKFEQVDGGKCETILRQRSSNGRTKELFGFQLVTKNRVVRWST